MKQITIDSEAFQRARQREIEKEHDHGLIREQVRHLKSLEQRPRERCLTCYFVDCRCGKAPTWEESESAGV
jgi:hypothetical protein